jgi:tetratricopeptide (TPR) repeat protein
MYNLNTSAETEQSQFLALNQQSLASLLTFVDFAADLTIGFIEIDREQERDWIVEWLIDSPQCQDVYFLVLTYNDPDLRFLLDEILKSLAQQYLPTAKSLVLIIKGLEHSISHTEYPPILQNLNFVRDAFVDALPYPILFCLPSYQITSIAKFAPDFWAWKSGNFKFESIEQESTFVDILPVEYSQNRKIPEPQNRIDLLERLLTEYKASPLDRNLPIVVSIFQQLGSAYQSHREWGKATEYLIEALNIINENSSLLIDKTTIWIELADVYREQQKYDRTEELCKRVLSLDRDIVTPPQWAKVNNILGLVYLENPQGKIAENLENAINYFQSTLAAYTYNNFSQDYAQVQNSLGKTYYRRIWGDRSENLELAIECYQASLRAYSKTFFHQELAVVYNNLGLAYQRRLRGDKSENMEQAIECYQTALRVLVKQISPQYWAYTQGNLGHAYSRRIQGKRAENFKKSIECYQNALKIYTPDAFPREWKQMQNLLNAISTESRS